MFDYCEADEKDESLYDDMWVIADAVLMAFTLCTAKESRPMEVVSLSDGVKTFIVELRACREGL